MELGIFKILDVLKSFVFQMISWAAIYVNITFSHQFLFIYHLLTCPVKFYYTMT